VNHLLKVNKEYPHRSNLHLANFLKYEFNNSRERAADESGRVFSAPVNTPMQV